MTALDVSSCGRYAQSCGRDMTGVVWEVGGGGGRLLLAGRIELFQEVKWETQTCLAGREMEGLRQEERERRGEGGERGHQEERDRGTPSCVDRSRQGDLLAVGEEGGQLSLLSFPVLSPSAPRRSYGNHGGRIRRVTFSCDDSLLLSTSGSDGCLLLWEVMDHLF